MCFILANGATNFHHHHHNQQWDEIDRYTPQSLRKNPSMVGEVHGGNALGYHDNDDDDYNGDGDDDGNDDDNQLLGGRNLL